MEQAVPEGEGEGVGVQPGAVNLGGAVGLDEKHLRGRDKVRWKGRGTVGRRGRDKVRWKGRSKVGRRGTVGWRGREIIKQKGDGEERCDHDTLVAEMHPLTR